MVFSISVPLRDIVRTITTHRINGRTLHCHCPSIKKAALRLHTNLLRARVTLNDRPAATFWGTLARQRRHSSDNRGMHTAPMKVLYHLNPTIRHTGTWLVNASASHLRPNIPSIVLSLVRGNPFPEIISSDVCCPKMLLRAMHCSIPSDTNS